MVPLVLIPPNMNIIDIIDISNSMMGYDDSGNEFGGLKDG